MSRVVETDIEAPFNHEEVGRPLYVSGHVRLGRWPSVTNLRAIDQRTDEDLVVDDMPDWRVDAIEAELVKEAKIIWEVE